MNDPDRDVELDEEVLDAPMSHAGYLAGRSAVKR
jgi:hypothetical protein